MNDIIIIGSNALNFRSPGEIVCNDYDLIGKYDSVMKFIELHSPYITSIVPIDGGKKIVAKLSNSAYHYSVIEAEIAWAGSPAEELMEYVICDHSSVSTKGDSLQYWIPTVDVLYALKMSHRFLKNSPHFDKTRQSIKTMRNMGAVIPQGLTDWFERREKATYAYGHPKLNVSKDKFFSGDGVKYVYDHDALHEAVKVTEVPAYTRFLDGPVKVSEEKWNALSKTHKLHAVLEESYVLALERSIIPFPEMRSFPATAFKMALEKVCTSITSGWFREFAWENYDNVMCLYVDYVTDFDHALSTGKLKPL